METRIYSTSGESEGNKDRNDDSITEGDLDSLLMSEVDNKKTKNKKWSRTRKVTTTANRINMT